MKLRLAATAIFLSGCTTLPKLPPKDQLNAAEIVRAVECELAEASKKVATEYPRLLNYGVGLKLTLVAEEDAEFSPDLNIIIPIIRQSAAVDILRGTVTPSANLEFRRRGRRTVVANVAYKFTQFTSMTCPQRTSEPQPLTSDLGIQEDMYVSLNAQGRGEIGQFGTTIQFIITKVGKISPGSSLQRLSGPARINPSFVLSGTREDDHTLDLSFTPISPDPGPTEVIVVSRRR